VSVAVLHDEADSHTKGFSPLLGENSLANYEISIFHNVLDTFVTTAMSLNFFVGILEACSTTHQVFFFFFGSDYS
jgi:hypothetical protein